MQLASRSIAHFDIVSEIGRGGMGVVYRATDTRLGRPVAVKTISADLLGDPIARRRFSTEARAASRLGHPYICQVHDVLEVDGVELIVMELLEGEDLAQRIARGLVDAADGMRIAVEVVEALREAHRHGILHRDIKPSNIFLTRSQHVKILDFGVASVAGKPTTGEHRLRAAAGPRQSGVVGTVGYLPPEQAMGNPVDERADIFSLGAVLYEMFSGRPAFHGDTMPAYLHATLAEEPPALSALRSGIPPGLSGLIALMLERSPDKRPGSMEIVHRRLLEIAARWAEIERNARRAPGLVLRRSVPVTRYARNGDASIAWQTFGEGPLDLVWLPGWISHLEQGWEQPRLARFLRGLAQFSRVILLDKRGTGLSDPADRHTALDLHAEDIRTVMDAAGSPRAVLMAGGEGAQIAAQFAALRGDRVAALVLHGARARGIRLPDYPWAPTPEDLMHRQERLVADWGGPVELDRFAPTLAEDAGFSHWWATYLRLGASPGAAMALVRGASRVDIRPLLPAIRVPTLVTHATGDRYMAVEEGRYVAGQIPGAYFAELPGDDHLMYGGGADILLDRTQCFIANMQDTWRIARALTTVLCLRAEDASAPAAADLLREIVPRHHGTVIVGPGGGQLLASFDGPEPAFRSGVRMLAMARDRGLTLSVGIHAAECAIAVGAAVAVAEAARPGQMLATAEAVDLVAGRPFTLSERRNVTTPVGVFAVTAVARRTGGAEDGWTAGASDRRVVAATR